MSQESLAPLMRHLALGKAFVNWRGLTELMRVELIGKCLGRRALLQIRWLKMCKMGQQSLQPSEV